MARYKAEGLLPGWFWRPSMALLGGLISGPTLPRINLWPLIFVSVFLLLWSVRKARFWVAVGTGFIGGASFYASQSVWMSAYLGPEPWLALAVLEGIIFGFGMGALAIIWNHHRAYKTKLGIWDKPLLILGLSLVWVAREWFNGHLPYGGYQWSRLGQPVADTFLARWAYWGGISAVSAAVAVLAITAVAFLDGVPSGRLARFTIWLPAIGALLLPAITVVPVNTHTRQLTVAAVQGNANAGLFANPIPGSILEKHLTETHVLLNQLDGKHLDLVVWPENASDLDPLSTPMAAYQLHQLSSAQLKAPLFIGAVTWTGDKAFNSVLLFDPKSGKVAKYDKRRPVPFAEYVPDRALWYAVAPQFIGLISHGFSSGTKPGLFNVSGTRVGSLICFEIGIDELSHDLVAGGAHLILSQANNSDFGHTDETFQQELLARLQAISTGRAVVHVSTVGVTELIQPDGRVTKRIPAFKPGYVLGNVPLETGLTPAMRWFGWVDYLSLGATAALLVWAVLDALRLRRKKFRQ